MEIKKNPKSNLENFSKIFMQIGLVLALFITYAVIEQKTYDKTYGELAVADMRSEMEEDIPIVMQQPEPPKQKPPPPPPTPEKIEIVEDEEEVEETVIESTETDQEEIVEVEDIEVEDDFDDVDVPFAVIEDVPLFPGCERVAKSERRACFQDKMNKHIRKNFRYPEIAQEMGIQGRVYVNFIISKDGSITNVRMRGPDKNLEKEASRIISKLPKMTPGKQRGRPVRVPFSIPITFRLN